MCVAEKVSLGIGAMRNFVDRDTLISVYNASLLYIVHPHFDYCSKVRKRPL